MQKRKPTYEELEKRIRELEARASESSEGISDDANEMRFRFLVDNAPEPIFIQTEFKFAYANKALLSMYGATDLSQILGTPVLDRIPDEYKEITLERMIALNQGTIKVPATESQHIRLDGTLCDVEVSAVQIQFMGLSGSLVFVRDITERKRSGEEIRRKNAFIQTVLDQLPIGVALNRISDGAATYINKKFQDIYGWPAEEMTGVTAFFEKVYPDPAYREEVMSRIFADIQSGVAENMHWEHIVITRKDGTKRIVNAANIPLPDQDIMVSTVLDVTGQQEAENALRQALGKAEESDRLKTAFLQNMSHEIRTPMNAICGFSEMIKDEDLTPDKRRDFTEIIINSSHQLLSIVNDVLSISTIETGQAKANYSTTDINEVLSELLAMFSPKAEAQGLEISVADRLPGAHSTVRTDDTKLKQILTNLISNALKFTVNGHVIFGVVRKKNLLEFYVKDSGIGIKPELHAAIFERFRQAGPDVSRQFGGTGLGLSISKSYAELMGGSIRLESALGEGSTFYVTLPFLPAKSETPASEVESPVPQSSSILIAEDEDYNYMYLEELLSKVTGPPLHARNGSEAVDICREKKDISMVIMDLKMPVMDGYEATREILKFRPGLPIIACTAYALPSELEEMGEPGFAGFLEKPVLPQKLFEVISKFVK